MNFFDQFTVLSSRAVDDHQMYFGGSVVSKASTIDIEISPTPPLIFTGVKMCEIWRRFNITQLWAVRVTKCSKISKLWKMKCCDDRPMSSPSLLKLGPSPLRSVCQSCPTPKIAWRKHGKLSITQPWIIRLRSNFAQISNAWHPKCCKSSGSRSQRSWHDTMCAKIRKIINNSAGNCSISLKFRTDFDHVTLDVPQSFKITGSNKGQGHNVT